MVDHINGLGGKETRIGGGPEGPIWDASVALTHECAAVTSDGPISPATVFKALGIVGDDLEQVKNVLAVSFQTTMATAREVGPMKAITWGLSDAFLQGARLASLGLIKV